jgi:hypothetical protein
MARYCKSLDIAVVGVANAVCYVALSDYFNENKELAKPNFRKFPLNIRAKPN